VLRDLGWFGCAAKAAKSCIGPTNAEAIRPLHQWAGTFERYWQHQLNRVKERAEAMVRQGSPDLNSPNPNLKEKR
jgi:hypothetical protein